MALGETHRLLIDLFHRALVAVEPERAVRATLTDGAAARFAAIIATGKAAPAMARAASRVTGNVPTLVVSDHTEPVPPEARLIVSDHPIPGQRSLEAGEAVLDLAMSLGPDDRLLYLLSGGTSALVEAPVAGVSIADVANITSALLVRGATIHEMNAVRAALSLIKGGGLERTAAPAAVTTLAISDVPDDNPAVIGSGPTVGGPRLDPGSVVRTYRLAENMSPPALRAIDAHSDTAHPTGSDFVIVSSGSVAAQAVADEARSRGLRVTVSSMPLRGEARDAATRCIETLRSEPETDLLVCAGETTVTVRGDGRGGRNQEAALAAAIHLEGDDDLVFLAAGTDGIDGPTEAAGGLVDGTTASRGRDLGFNARETLERNDSNTWLVAVGSAMLTGPTGTNVGDLWLVARRRRSA